MEQKKSEGAITVSENGTVFSGSEAVNVFQLAAVAAGLRLEMAGPKGMKISRVSALSVAKRITKLRTNRREVHLDKIMELLKESKTKVLYFNKDYRKPKPTYKAKK